LSRNPVWQPDRAGSGVRQEVSAVFASRGGDASGWSVKMALRRAWIVALRCCFSASAGVLVRSAFGEVERHQTLDVGIWRAQKGNSVRTWRSQNRWVLVRDPSGQRDAQAFLGTDLDLEPTAIFQRFVCRWRIETTFQEVRQHLGVETQRQWLDRAILRTIPALLGLYSLVTIWAHGLTQKSSTVVRTQPAVWYYKGQPTFSDAIAAVRRVLWAPPSISMCPVRLRKHRNSGPLVKSIRGDRMSRRLKRSKSSLGREGVQLAKL
jgi:hypothetical protein